MTKRSQWVLCCLMWAGVWFFLGIIFPPLWLFTILSAAMVFIPVGVPDTLSYNNRHNPQEWNKRDGS